MKSFISINDGSNLTEISPVLTCIRTLNESDALWEHANSKYFKSLSLKQLKSETDISKEDGFCFAVSLRDGACVYTSKAISYHLGYPKDMLLGQCMMNFLYHKDHITFANHLTQGLNACFMQGKRDDSHLVVNTFFCRLRVYQGLKYGYSVSKQKVQYKPFKITLHINELILDDMCVEKASGTLCVKSTATQVSPAYTVPDEIPAMTSFSTRHTASCHFSHVDASAIPYLGYLPQDMIGYSVFDFYHVDDMPKHKDIYELVVKEHGSSFRSKPYRFKVQNGCYIMLETEWSCFINPWSHKLEFVVGQHKVLKGPSDITIFNPCEVVASEETTKECQVIQKEIKALLSQSMQNFGHNRTKRYCNKRKRDLASFVYNCVADESYSGNKQKSNSEPQGIIDNGSNSDPDSVVMGDISPYREVNDSSISSETPQTVQQLRYQENIERFFASQPKTYSDGSDEFNKNVNVCSGEGYQSSSSDSRNESGNVSKEQNESPSYESKNQESSSNSSKCNLLCSATGDSGYGKSLEKEGIMNTSVSQASSCNQQWKSNLTDCITGNAEKFSSSLALTEETLSVHNRINHKHLRQQLHKYKTTAGLCSASLGENNWFQRKDSGHAKHKKCSHLHNFTTSSPVQTDVVKVTSAIETTFKCQPSAVCTSFPDNQQTSSCIPNVMHSGLFAPNTFTGSAPTPGSILIPVVFMGSVPYCPSVSAVHPQTGGTFWPCNPAVNTELPFEGFPFPVVSPNSICSSATTPTGFIYPSYQTLKRNSNCNPFSAAPNGVCSSGATATSLLATTTTTVAPGTVNSFQNIASGSVAAEKEFSITGMQNSGAKKQCIKTEVNEYEMQVDDTQSPLFSCDSLLQSADKDKDVDFDIRKCYAGPSRSNKVELSSEIAYRYQMTPLNMEDVLKKDMEALKGMQQPDLVNKQLQLLKNEVTEEKESRTNTEGGFNMTETAMLGLTNEDEMGEELEYQEDFLSLELCADY